METCKYGSGADKRKPTAVKRKGVVYRAYKSPPMKQLRKRTASQSKKITLYEDETLRAAIRYPGARKNKQVEQSNNL